ncbi:MAG TPA: homoserine kinase [Alphaproteobacteria bacterium]|nr:homoserine kinase [Alphaproteobacteria bacterium]HNS44041.1 homoserine kinase [Alphaproteobacteria bacterium]
MAVYTHLTNGQIESLLQDYDLGPLVSAEGIVQGIDNTNYKIETATGKFILTIFERRIDPSELPYFLDLMDHLQKSGIHCPSPLPLKNTSSRGHSAKPNLHARDPKSGTAILYSTINDKPCAIFTFIEGRGIAQDDITPALCAELGTLLGKMHLAGQTTSLHRTNSMGPDAWEARLQKTKERGLEFLKELEFLKQHWPQDLPTGNIHADLFPDNVFILNNHIHGVIDFYFACTDFLVYDLAIVMNAWCFDKDGNFIPERWDVLLNGYESIRTLNKEEKDSYQILCRGAALRILSTRLHDLVFHDPTALVKPHDPTEYTRKLEFHRDHKLF